MGNVSSYLPIQGRKRKRKETDESNENDVDEELLRILHTPKRKKISTSQYIYKALYEDGQNSDITIIALEKVWKLHKVYLCQSPYFASMFSGSWKEANAEEISIEIADPNVTTEALDLVFGSLYQDEILIQPAQVVPILGAAVHFQLESLIQQCLEIARDNINTQTVLAYFTSAQQYGLEKIENSCFKWLLKNISIFPHEAPLKLREMSCELLTKLLETHEIFMIQTEFSAYVLLKTWVFVKKNKEWTGSNQDCILAAHKYFQEREGNVPYLETSEGQKYLSAFQALRLSHLVNHLIDVEMLEADKIIPADWLYPIFRMQWMHMLKIDQGIDKGPFDITEEEFNKSCMRCGRVLTGDVQNTWRWIGYNFGLDLLVTYSRRRLLFKRNNPEENEPNYISRPTRQRHIIYRLSLASVDKMKQIKGVHTTSMEHLALSKNEEVMVLEIPKDWTFPLLLSANFLVTTPSTLAKSVMDNSIL